MDFIRNGLGETQTIRRVTSSIQLKEAIRDGLPGELVEKAVEMQQHKRHSVCKVHNSLNLNLDDEPGSAPPEREFSVTPRETVQLLSKDAISEMVVSVRDLSNNLSNISMKLNMRNVLIVSKIMDQSLIPITKELALWLLSLKTSHGPLNVSVQDVLRDHPAFDYDGLRKSGAPELRRLRFWTQEMCFKNPNLFDFVITLGGDGTVLFTSWLFQNIVPPVLSIGLGSLGFMTEYSYEDRKAVIRDSLDNGISCSLRMRFSCTIMRAISRENKEYNELQKEIESGGKYGTFRNHKVSESYCILNDVVVDRGPNPTITTTELYGDFKFLTAMEADGVVISTPSGSTAYSLSAGGSLVHPDIPAILISPICAHTLSFRPLVLPDSLIIRVGVPYDARSSAWCSFDGKCRVELNKGDFLTISASRYPFPKVTNGRSNTSWFEGLSKTLHWNERKRQKAYNF
jgi:NAD+ kinase